MNLTSWSARLAAAVLAAALGLAAPAAAATVSCPGTEATGDREFSLAVAGAASCFASGSGNLSGNAGGAKPDPLFALLGAAFGPGHALIDKSDEAAGGRRDGALAEGLTSGLSGGFAFKLPGAPKGQTWTNVILAFKSGQGRTGPDWAAFLLPAGVSSGSWTISGRQELSHANLYAQLSPVPLPAAAWLLLGGMAGLGAVARKRKRAA